MERPTGSAIWITGLSGAGKTTIAKALFEQVTADRGFPPILIDGDEFRSIKSQSPTGYDMAARLENAYQIAKLTKLLVSQGHLVIVATMSLFHEIHNWNRENIGHYCEVFLDVPMDVLRHRNSKNLYKLSSDNSAENVVGIDQKPEFPSAPHLVLDVSMLEKQDDCIELIRKAAALHRDLVEHVGVRA